MALQSYKRLLGQAERMAYVAHDRSLRPRQRAGRVHQIAQSATKRLAELGEPVGAGDYLPYARIGAWLACSPSLEAVAAGRGHYADISAGVLHNLKTPLRELLLDVTSDVHGGRGGGSAHGLLGEISVLGALVWSHANNPQRQRSRVLPATASQDESIGRRQTSRAGGFDLLHDSGIRVTPMQVKCSSSRVISGAMRGDRPYHRYIAQIYVTSLVGNSTPPEYAPQILADAVLTEDTALLTHAVNAIDSAVASAEFRFTNAWVFYQDLPKRDSTEATPSRLERVE